jgi:hypothetical protein
MGMIRNEVYRGNSSSCNRGIYMLVLYLSAGRIIWYDTAGDYNTSIDMEVR